MSLIKIINHFKLFIKSKDNQKKIPGNDKAKMKEEFNFSSAEKEAMPSKAHDMQNQIFVMCGEN